MFNIVFLSQTDVLLQEWLAHVANCFTETENQPKHEQLISTHQV